MTEYVVVCRDCELEKPFPKQELAEHAKRVHEKEYGHAVTIER